MCFFLIRHFFIYVFQSFVYIFAKNSDRRDVLGLSDCITLSDGDLVNKSETIHR